MESLLNWVTVNQQIIYIVILMIFVGIEVIGRVPSVLHTPLIMVLGHESCGALKAAIDASDNNTQFPGHIQSIASALAPAVRAIDKQSKNRIDDVIKMNVIQNVKELKKQTPILSRLVAEKKLLVVGGVYNLKTGKVDIVA